MCLDRRGGVKMTVEKKLPPPQPCTFHGGMQFTLIEVIEGISCILEKRSGLAREQRRAAGKKTAWWERNQHE